MFILNKTFRVFGLVSASILIASCGKSKPTAIEISDLNKSVSTCFVERTATINEAENGYSGLANLGAYIAEFGAAPIKSGWRITTEDRSNAKLVASRNGVNYECEFTKKDDSWILTKSLWDDEEAYSLQAMELVKEQAQTRHETTWKERGWMGETYKYYALAPVSSSFQSDKKLAINCRPSQRGVMLNGFLNYGANKEIDFAFDDVVESFGVDGGGSNSYIGQIKDGFMGEVTTNQVEIADRFIELLRDTDTLTVMNEKFAIGKSNLSSIPCLTQ